MQSLLDSLMTWVPSGSETLDLPAQSSTDGSHIWEPYINMDTWDFEIDFWANLADHPTLISHDK